MNDEEKLILPNLTKLICDKTEREMVPVYKTDKGEYVVSGTELHRILGVRSYYRDWVKNRLNDCDATEGEDFQTFAKKLAKGRPTQEYIIKLDTAKEMAMLERNEKGKQVRRYFIEVEKKHNRPDPWKRRWLSSSGSRMSSTRRCFLSWRRRRRRSSPGNRFRTRQRTRQTRSTRIKISSKSGWRNSTSWLRKCRNYMA